MNDREYVHIVEIDEENRVLKIYRSFLDGSRQLYTEAELPTHASDSPDSPYTKFVRMLGENILVDSPSARRIIGI